MSSISESLRVSINLLNARAIVNLLDSLSLIPAGANHSRTSWNLSKLVRGHIPSASNNHVSEAAKALWDSMTTADINDFLSGERFTTDVLTQPISVDTCLGSKSSISTLSILPGKSYCFKDIFIEEHLTPASDVQKAIMEVYSQNRGSSELPFMVNDILEKVHVARILRTENVRIKRSKRASVSYIIDHSSDECFNNIYSTYYIPNGVILK